MKKTIFSIIVIIYVIIAIFTTMCLLSYNEYRVSQFGDNSLIIVNKNNATDDYKQGDLVIINKNSIQNTKIGDKLFYYTQDGVKISNIIDVKDFGEIGKNFVIDGNFTIVEDDVAGSSNDSKIIRNLGGILDVLESRWGFLFIIIFPSLFAFLYEVYMLILEISNKRGNK